MAVTGHGPSDLPPEPGHGPSDLPSEPGSGPSDLPSEPGDTPPGPEDDPLTPPPAGPPGGRVFSLEGRQAPGLYLVAWILSVGGLVLIFLIGPMASDDSARLVLILAGALTITTGLAAGAGSQVLDRRDRHPGRYRGPSPVLVFMAYFFALAAFGVVLAGAGLSNPEDSTTFLVVGLIQVLGYVVAVWLFAVRSGALSWRAMGWPTWDGDGVRPVLRAIGVSVLYVLPATILVLIGSGALAMLLGVEAPDVLPTPSTSVEALAIAAAAGLIIPVGEELFFRGFAVTAWMRDLGPRAAIVRSSAFFALVHVVNITTGDFGEGLAQVVLQTAAILPMGLLFGWLFVRHGMAAAIGGHATYNSLLLLLLLASSYLVEYLPEANAV